MVDKGNKERFVQLELSDSSLELFLVNPSSLLNKFMSSSGSQFDYNVGCIKLDLTCIRKVVLNVLAVGLL